MGTRCLTRVFDEADREILCMYRQMDGYPDGHGQELHEFVDPFRIVNGIGCDDNDGHTANGMECLAAQIVAHFKTGIGSFYLHAPGTSGIGEEWVYTVKSDDAGRAVVSVKEV